MTRSPAPSGRISSHFFDVPSLLQFEHRIPAFVSREPTCRPVGLQKRLEFSASVGLLTDELDGPWSENP